MSRFEVRRKHQLLPYKQEIINNLDISKKTIIFADRIQQ